MMLQTQPGSGAGSAGSSAGPGHSTKACQNCSRAKAKCLPLENDAKCARCSRLNKECVTVPRSTRKRRSPNTASNTAALEQKIESLVSLLSSTQAPGMPLRPSHLTPPDSQGISEPSPPTGGHDDTEFPSAERRWAVPPTAGSCHAGWISSGAQCAQDFVGGHDLFPPMLNQSGVEIPAIARQESRPPPPMQDANALLTIFQEQFLPRFPFITIPDKMSVDLLRSQRPWLYKSVMMVAFQDDRSRQIEIKKSLDMLQGMIVYNAWSYYYSPVIPSWQSTGIHQLSLALLFDLGLTRPTRDNDGPLTDVTMARSQKEESERTLDDRRALLCCYFLTSVSAFCLKKIDVMRFSAYIEHCCEVLLTTAEYDSDILLASLCKLQNIVEPVYRCFADKVKVNDTKAPVWMLVKMVRAEMENLWKSLPVHIQQDPIMLFSFNSAEVFTFEPSIYKPFFQTRAVGGINSQRIDMLYGCLVSSQKLLNCYIDQPIAAYKGLCVIDLSHMGRGLSTLLKLSLVEETGWDLVHIRQTVDLSYYFNELASRFERIGEVVDRMQKRPVRDRASSFHTGCARAMRMVQQCRYWGAHHIFSRLPQSFAATIRSVF
ncbi:hypothetical protein BKA65DRAFT_28790 [Rhexocercosporidium sp. MPI-PUGE-AT-0058]|nr:hypothetical protein BKA65DRAFT_28790 [Rhexocercosporidium sp. MPI-PUGE-AT-0058]